MENVFTLESDSFALNVNSTSVNASCLKVSENSRDNVGLDIPYVVMEILVAMFATSGNLLVITVFLRERRLRKRTNHYIVSLALADFLVGILGIPCAIMVKTNNTKKRRFKCKLFIDFSRRTRKLSRLSFDDVNASVFLHSFHL